MTGCCLSGRRTPPPKLHRRPQPLADPGVGPRSVWRVACGVGVRGWVCGWPLDAPCTSCTASPAGPSWTRQQGPGGSPHRPAKESRREKLRCVGERRELLALRCGVCTRARRTNCLRCSSRFVMNFFVRIVTAPSDMVAPKDLQPKGKSCESSAKKYALWPSMGFAGVMRCEVRRPVSAARGCTAICCPRARGGRGNATEGSSGRRPPGCVLEDRQP